MAGTGLVRSEEPSTVVLAPPPVSTVSFDSVGDGAAHYVVTGSPASSSRRSAKEVRMTDWRPLTPNRSRVRLTSSATKTARYLSEHGQKFGDRVAHMVGQIYTVVENVPPAIYKVYDPVSDANGVQGGMIYLPYKALSVLMDESVSFEVKGKIGIRYDLQTGCVSEVKPGGHAKALGVQVGWTVYKIDGKPFSDKLLTEKLANPFTPYTITFLKERDQMSSLPRERSFERQEMWEPHIVDSVGAWSSTSPQVVHLHLGPDPPEETPPVEYSRELLLPDMPVSRGMQGDELEKAFSRERCKRKVQWCMLFMLFVLVAVLSWRVSYRAGWNARQAEESWKSYAASVSSICSQNERHLLYIGIASAPANFEQRMLVRDNWLRQAKRYYGGRVKIEFLLGHLPTQPQDHASVMVARNMEQRVQDEAFKYGDIKRVPIVDAELFSTDKLIWTLKSGYDWNAMFILAVNDQQHVQVQAAITNLTKREDLARPVYFGEQMMKNYMEGADGRIACYFGDHCAGISGDLACKMVSSHLNDFMGFPTYGTSKAEVNLAQWVKFEDGVRRQHGILSVEQINMPEMCSPLLPQISPTPR